MDIKIIIQSPNNLYNSIVNKKIINITKKNNINYKGPIFLPNKKKLFNILKSPHIHKDSRDQLIIKKNTHVFYIINITKKFLKKLMLINIHPLIKINIFFLKKK